MPWVTFNVDWEERSVWLLAEQLGKGFTEQAFDGFEFGAGDRQVRIKLISDLARRPIAPFDWARGRWTGNGAGTSHAGVMELDVNGDVPITGR